jgi:hypothetical protein
LRTPAGTDCPHYYEDFNRGREIQECRLIQRSRTSLPWRPSDCKGCPVPPIRHANPSPDLRLELSIVRRFGLFRSHRLEAHCLRVGCETPNPIAGCERCLPPARRA